MKLVKQDTEHEMITAFIEGREEGFNHIFHQYYAATCFFAHKLTGDQESAEDIVSNAFMKVWQRHYQFTGEQNIRAYLYQVIRNDCFKYLEKLKRNNQLNRDLSYLNSSDTETPVFNHIIHAELLRALYHAMDQLPAQCRQVCQMFFIEGKTTAEISKELDLSSSTVKTQKARGIKAMRKVRG